MVPLEGVARYELPRAALRMLHKHADLFAEYVTVDCEKLFETFTAGSKVREKSREKTNI